RGRIAHRAAELHLALVERGVVLRAGELQRVVVRLMALQDHLTRDVASAGASRDLGQQLERPLGRAEVGSPRPTSASITPTSVTRGKSCPLAIICVPTSTSSAPLSNACSVRRTAPFLRARSRSKRSARTLGSAARSASSTRSVPNP